VLAGSSDRSVGRESKRLKEGVPGTASGTLFSWPSDDDAKSGYRTPGTQDETIEAQAVALLIRRRQSGSF
jgi:hypothetical protein